MKADAELKELVYKKMKMFEDMSNNVFNSEFTRTYMLGKADMLKEIFSILEAAGEES